MAGPRIQITTAVIWCLVAAGPIFGFAALKPVLRSEGVYSEICGVHSKTTCAEQDLKLNFMFTVAAGVTNIVALPVGYILDHWGPRVCGFIGSVFLAVGALLFSEGWYLVGYSSLAVGGPFVFISSFQLANSVPKHSGKILSLITGAFDTSSALFMVYRLWYQSHDNSPSTKSFFHGYLVVPLYIVLCQAFLMPQNSYKTLGLTQKIEVEGLDENGELMEGDDGSRIIPDEAERARLIRRHSMTPRRPTFVAETRNTAARRVTSVTTARRKSILEDFVAERLKRKTQGVYGVMHHRSLSDQVGSPWFWFMLALTILCMLRINYFVATVGSQENYLLGPERASRLTGLFDIALPAGGLVAIPLTGVVLDGLPTLTVLRIMITVSVIIGLLGCVSSYGLNLIGIILLVVYRPFYYTVVSDYCAKVFGFETFGTVYGLIMSISGIFTMMQTVVDQLTQTHFKMNPVPLNMVLTASTAVAGCALIAYGQRVSNERLITPAESAIVEEMPYGAI